jgi:nicotinate phosphoribosyltransferase
VIIESLLDTDLYKFTMMQVVLHRFPGAQVEYRFKCRTPGVDLTADVEQIRREVRYLCSLRFAEGELDYLRGLRFIRSDFVDFLGLFHLNTKYIQIEPAAGRAGEIEVTIRGPWLHTILFEIPVLAIINETYYRRTAPAADLAEGRRRLREKIGLIRSEPALSAVRIADYGTRRRFSRAWQDEVLCTLKSDLRENLAGTSNVLYAWTRGLTPVGTWRTNTCRPARRSVPACGTRRPSASKPGPASTAAIWASRCRMFTGWTRSCAISTCTSASCSTAPATIRATRCNGASG